MRLTVLRAGYRKYYYGSASGKPYAGKNRIPYLFASAQRKKFVEDLKQECTNEMWLTRTFLSKAQEEKLKTKLKQSSRGGRLIVNNAKDNFHYRNTRYRINMKPNVTFEERWTHLKDKEPWTKERVDRSDKLILARYAEACVPKNYPDFWPRAEENWDEWNKIEGFGKKNSERETDEKIETDVHKLMPKLTIK